MLPINYIAVLVAALANFIIGFMFHGPFLGKTWMRLANIHPTGNEKFADMLPQILKNFLVNIIFACVLSVMYLFASTSPLLGGGGSVTGMLVSLLVWFGFIFTTTSIDVIWMGKSYKLWWFELFASLVSCLAMGAIIGAW
jgi:hypothetical protein